MLGETQFAVSACWQSDVKKRIEFYLKFFIDIAYRDTESHPRHDSSLLKIQSAPLRYIVSSSGVLFHSHRVLSVVISQKQAQTIKTINRFS